MENASQQILEVSEIELSYRPRVKPSQRPKIASSKEAADLFRRNWDPDKFELLEQFKVMLLNRANKVIGILTVSSGGIAGTVADPKLIFGAAVKGAACGIIVAHNHPSGNLNASTADLDLTKKLKEGGRVLEIQILDHLILTSEGYYSFADEGLL